MTYPTPAKYGGKLPTTWKNFEDKPNTLFPDKKISKVSRCCAALKNLINKIYHFFSRIFSCSAQKKHQWAKHRFQRSKDIIPHFHNLPRRGSVVLEEDHFLPEELITRKHRLPDRAIAIKAASEGIPKVKPIEVDSVGVLAAYRFEEDEVFPDEILPTSHLVAYPKDLRINHLANAFKLYLDGQGRGIIRSGKIDSVQRAEDFAHLLNLVRNQAIEESGNSEIVLRVMSHQLNSFEMETSFIRDQHRSLVKINQECPGFEIIHINTPTVRFYDWSKKIDKMPKSQLLHKALRNSEAASRKQNLEAWGTYFNWIMADLKDHELLTDGSKEWQDVQKEMREHVEEIQLLLYKEAGLLCSSTKQIKGISQVRKEINQHLKKLHINLNASLDGLNYLRQNLDQNSKEFRKVDLFYRVLASQLKKPGQVLHRGHEQLMIQLLNKEMNVTAAVNCRSGLDRTGYLHSVMVSLEQIGHDYSPQRIHEMVVNWDRLTPMLNRASKKEVESLLEESADAQVLKTIIEFRKLFIHNLLRIGLPITTLNTGYVGFKWQSGVYFNLVENLIPLNFLPPTINRNTNDEKETVRLVKYNKKTGMPIGLTVAGRQVLTPLSEMRGA